MISRRKRFLCFVGASLMLGVSGCGYTEQSKFQSFLPSTPHPSNETEISPPPTVQPDLYLHETPALLIQAQKEVVGHAAAAKSDLLMQRADQAYQRGRNPDSACARWINSCGMPSSCSTRWIIGL